MKKPETYTGVVRSVSRYGEGGGADFKFMAFILSGDDVRKGKTAVLSGDHLDTAVRSLRDGTRVKLVVTEDRLEKCG